MYMYRHLLTDERLKNTHNNNNNRRRRRRRKRDRRGCVGAPFALRHVGVIWLVFHVLNFYRLALNNRTCVASANLRWNICKNRIEIRTFLDLVMVIGCAWLAVDFLTGYTHVLPTVFTIECIVVMNIWRRSPISFKHVSLWCLLTEPHTDQI